LVNRGQLIRSVADKTGVAKKDVEQVYEHTIRAIQDAVKSGERVALSGFGAFRQRVTKARKAGMQRNPFTGDMVKVGAKPAKKAPRFTPAKQFKEYVGGSLKLPALTAAKPAAKAAKAAKKSAKKAPAKKGAKKGAKKAKRR
jgi:DNA-binding protein HU-beta